MASSDPWSKTDQMEDAVLDGMVTRLEARGNFKPFMKMLDEYLGAMEIDGKQEVLDMGCGTGIARKESRGAHYRSDFTDQDDEGYLCNFILTRDDPTPRKQQVAMPRLRPVA